MARPQIHGKQIKNGSVGGWQIQDGSITLDKLTDEAKHELANMLAMTEKGDTCRLTAESLGHSVRGIMNSFNNPEAMDRVRIVVRLLAMSAAFVDCQDNPCSCGRHKLYTQIVDILGKIHTSQVTIEGCDGE